jgi:hypothetical protein
MAVEMFSLSMCSIVVCCRDGDASESERELSEEYAEVEWLRHRIFHRIDVADFGGFPRVCGRWVFCIGRFGLCEPSKVAKRHKGSGQQGASRGCRHCCAVTERANVPTL